jgi:hypothetical protein
MAACFYQLVYLLIIQAKTGWDEIEKPQKIRLVDVFETQLDKMRLDGLLRGRDLLCLAWKGNLHQLQGGGTVAVDLCR